MLFRSSSEEKALEFAQQRGGELLQINDISSDMVLAPVDHSMMDMSEVPVEKMDKMDNMSGDSTNMQMQPSEQESNK